MGEVNKKEKKPVMDGYAATRTVQQVLDSRLEQLPD